MKYSIQSIQYFDDYEKANLTFEDAKKHFIYFVDINVNKVNEQKTLIQLIENDHEEEEERMGCVVLKTLDKEKETILKEPKLK